MLTVLPWCSKGCKLNLVVYVIPRVGFLFCQLKVCLSRDGAYPNRARESTR